MKQEEFIRTLIELDVVKFGDFTLKSGARSPFYLDLRQLLKSPAMLETAADYLAEKAGELEFDLIVGIPYTAVPLASLLAVKLNKPLIIPRKEQKEYGTGGMIMGSFKKGNKCLVIDDLITNGSSKIETAALLEKSGLQVKDFLVIIDRRKEGDKSIEEKGFSISSLFSLNDIIKSLETQHLLSSDKSRAVMEYISPPVPELTRKLLELINVKRSNLILSLDVTSQKEFFGILDKVADKIVVLKTHIDILDDFSPDFIDKLNLRKKKHSFLIFEDRKFADIGNTVKHQYRNGIYKIEEWADFVTIHGVAGPGTLTGIMEGTKNRGAFLLARMSSCNNLITEEYTNRIIAMGEAEPSWVCGYIGHGKNREDIRRFKKKIPIHQLLLMPGVKKTAGTDSLGQQYLTVEEAVKGGADLIILGRGLYQADFPEKEAEEYREEAWNYYIEKQGNGRQR